MLRRWTSIPGLILLTLLFITSCGVPAPVGGKQGSGNHTPENPPFTVLVNREKTGIDTQYDPQRAVGNLYHQITVYSADGRQTVLNAENQPILFSAYWCPHCQRTLVLLNQHASSIKNLPIIVSTGFAPGTSLQTAKRLTEEEEQGLHLSGMTVDYLLGSRYQQYVPQGFPTLAYESQGKVDLLIGEHTLQVWQRALAMQS